MGSSAARPWAAIVASTFIAGGALADPAHAQDADERARQVYQIFKSTCVECHGETAKGGLDLRTHKTLMQGGDSGDVVVPHQPAKSLLYLLVTHTEEPPMPRKKPKLREADVDVIRARIEDGGSLEAVEDAVPENAFCQVLFNLNEFVYRP